MREIAGRIVVGEVSQFVEMAGDTCKVAYQLDEAEGWPPMRLLARIDVQDQGAATCSSYLTIGKRPSPASTSF